MPISDKTLALAIPQELKTDHPDSSLVVQGIIIALAACEDAPSFGGPAKRMKAVHDALRDIYVPIVKAHLAKEDEDWGALKAKADAYIPVVKVAVKRERSEFAQYVLSGHINGTAFAERNDDGTWQANVWASGESQPGSYGGTSTSARGALIQAIGDRGGIAVFDDGMGAPVVKEPEPTPGPESSDEWGT
jgi:hypothetical protein